MLSKVQMILFNYKVSIFQIKLIHLVFNIFKKILIMKVILMIKWVYVIVSGVIITIKVALKMKVQKNINNINKQKIIKSKLKIHSLSIWILEKRLWLEKEFNSLLFKNKTKWKLE